jgi:hypothetical protein
VQTRAISPKKKKKPLNYTMQIHIRATSDGKAGREPS